MHLNKHNEIEVSSAKPKSKTSLSFSIFFFSFSISLLLLCQTKLFVLSSFPPSFFFQPLASLAHGFLQPTLSVYIGSKWSMAPCRRGCERRACRKGVASWRWCPQRVAAGLIGVGALQVWSAGEDKLGSSVARRSLVRAVAVDRGVGAWLYGRGKDWHAREKTCMQVGVGYKAEVSVQVFNEGTGKPSSMQMAKRCATRDVLVHGRKVQRVVSVVRRDWSSRQASGEEIGRPKVREKGRGWPKVGGCA